jgi:hypothetical protein
MKTVKIESKNSVKAAKPRRVAGVQVRSGVKAGRIPGELGEPGGPGKPGGFGKPGGLGDPGGFGF